MAQKTRNGYGAVFFILVFLSLSCCANAPDLLAGINSRPAEPIRSFGPIHRKSFLRQSYSCILPAIADLDGDHLPDIAVASQVESSFGINVHLTSRPQKIFLPTQMPPLGATLIVADINHDQDLDLIIASPAFLRPVAVWLGNGKGHFREWDRRQFASLFEWCDTASTIDGEADILQMGLLNSGNFEPDYSNDEVVGFKLNGFGNVAASSHVWFSQGKSRQLTSRSPPLILPL